MPDTVIEKYTDEEGSQVTVVKDLDGQIFHCWDLPLSEEVVSFIKEEAKKEGVEPWELVNSIVKAYLENYE